MKATSLYLPVLLGTVRDGNQSQNVARWVLHELAQRPGVETRLFDPKDIATGNLTEGPSGKPRANPKLRAFGEEMARADGFVVVLPEYNRGVPGTLKNLLDHFHPEWNRKPFGIVSAGGQFGGIRAAEQLREIVGGLNAIAIPQFLAVQNVWEAFGPQGPTSNADGWRGLFEQFIQDLEWYATALQFARKHPEQLLARSPAKTVAPIEFAEPETGAVV